VHAVEEFEPDVLSWCESTLRRMGIGDDKW
jgi:hypothetical protein